MYACDELMLINQIHGFTQYNKNYCELYFGYKINDQDKNN